MAIAQEKKAAAESNARYQKENAKVDKVVDLMEKWGRECEAMGSRIKAAYACSEFEQFLERKEKVRKRYRKEQDASSLSSFSSDED